MTGVWILEDGVIYQEGAGVLYDCLDDWLDKEGQQILCDLMNEGWDKTPFDEVEPILNERLKAKAKLSEQINPERALQELCHWAQSRSGYLQIVFAGTAPLTEQINGVDIPHPWMCNILSEKQAYTALGVTMEEAIVSCYAAWQGGDGLIDFG